jgi:hypothetical protein
MINDFAVARALHVLALVHWIGGVTMVTTIVLPRAGALADVTRLRLIHRSRFRQWAARCTPTIQADDVERVLADINADNGNRAVEVPRHGVLLVFGAPCQLGLLAGQEHGRTIPLAEVARSILLWCTTRLPSC